MKASWAATAVALGTLTALIVPSAAFGAEPSENARAVQAIEAIEQVAPEVFEVWTGEQERTAGRQSLAQQSVVATPSNPDAGITIGRGEESLHIGLPVSDDTVALRSSQAPAPVFENGDGSVVVPVGKSDSTVQITTVIESADAPSRYDYPLTLPDGVSTRAEADGSISLLGPDGAPVGIIDAPWALDANGQSVATSYELTDGVLTQIVATDTPGIAFPVVADPQVTYMWWGYVIKYTKAETAAIGSQASYAHALNLMCVWIPHIAVRALCATIGVAIIQMYWGIIQSAKNQGKCLQLNAAYAGPIPTTAHVVSC